MRIVYITFSACYIAEALFSQLLYYKQFETKLKKKMPTNREML